MLVDTDEWDDPGAPTKDSADWALVAGERVVWVEDEFPAPVAVVAARRIGDPAVLDAVQAALDQLEEEATQRDAGRIRSFISSHRWLALASVALIVAAAVAIPVLVLGDRAEKAYLEDLRDSGLGGRFASDAEALAYGNSVCSRLRTGSKPQGQPVDLTAVRHLCSEFKQGFRVLEKLTVNGTFTLLDTDFLTCRYYCSSSISGLGGSCYGTGGYSDIGPGTDVVVKNGSGKVLATTSLGSGDGGLVSCKFTFSFEITEGEDTYEVSVSRRGTQHYTFSQLKTDGIALTLGD